MRNLSAVPTNHFMHRQKAAVTTNFVLDSASSIILLTLAKMNKYSNADRAVCFYFELEVHTNQHVSTPLSHALSSPSPTL